MIFLFCSYRTSVQRGGACSSLRRPLPRVALRAGHLLVGQPLVVPPVPRTGQGGGRLRPLACDAEGALDLAGGSVASMTTRREGALPRPPVTRSGLPHH